MFDRRPAFPSNDMHFAARSALLASCLALRVHALPLTSYSVVDVDGGSSAADAADDQPTTVFQTVTKSSEAEKSEPTTVSVTVVETTSVKHSDVPTSHAASSLRTSANASTTPHASSAAASSSLDALSVLASAQSSISAHGTGTASPEPPLTTKAPVYDVPSAQAPAPTKPDGPGEDCDIPQTTVTADIPDSDEAAEESTKGPSETVTLLSTTTVTPAAESTSYYDDGMWHTRYAVKPSAAAPEVEHNAPTEEKVAAPVEQEPQEKKPSTPTFANNTTPQGTGAPKILVQPLLPMATGNSLAARQVNEDAPFPTLSPVQGTGAPQILSNPFRAEGTGIAARAAATGGALADPEVLVAARAPAASGIIARAAPSGILARDAPSGVLARAEPTGIVARAAPTGIVARAAATGILARGAPASYNVVSWNETAEA